MQLHTALLSFSAIGTVAIIIFLIRDQITCLKYNLTNKTNLLQKYATENNTLKTELDKHKPQETMTLNKQTCTELDSLIAQTKGKFFSIEFVKKDGSLRVANGKDKYYRLLKNGNSKVRDAGFASFVDRNKESWISATDTSVIRFKCGKLEKDIQI